MVPVVIFVGDSNSGKTACIEKIIPELKNRGYKIGAIKHAPRGFKLDYEKRDSYRMTQAGANTVVISSSDRLGMIKKIDTELYITDLRKNFLKDVDVIIVEGCKHEDFPHIAVFKDKIIQGELRNYREKLIAVICDSEIDDVEKDIVNVPCFQKHESDKTASFIIKKIIGKKKRRKYGAKQITV